MRTLFFIIILFAGLWACNPPAATPTEQPPAVAQTESGEPLGAGLADPTFYVSYHLVRSGGAITSTAGIFIQTKAWNVPPVGQAVDPTLLMRDLIKALTASGVLTGVDLTQTAKNWLIVLYPGAAPRRDFILDSRLLPVKPK